MNFGADFASEIGDSWRRLAPACQIRAVANFWRSSTSLSTQNGSQMMRSLPNKPAVRVAYQHAISTIPFYRDRYAAAGLVVDSLKVTDDWRRVPLFIAPTSKRTSTSYSARPSTMANYRTVLRLALAAAQSL